MNKSQDLNGGNTIIKEGFVVSDYKMPV